MTSWSKLPLKPAFRKPKPVRSWIALPARKKYPKTSNGFELGLEGVPFFVVNGAPAVARPQDAEAFLQAFQHALGLDKSSQTI